MDGGFSDLFPEQASKVLFCQQSAKVLTGMQFAELQLVKPILK